MASSCPGASDEIPFLFAMSILKENNVEREQCRYLEKQLPAALFSPGSKVEPPLVAGSLPWAIALLSLTSDGRML